jgi:asparagine synthase (glutamine-hydrolysing)
VEHLYHRFLKRISKNRLKQLYGPLLKDYPEKKIDDPLEDLVDEVRDLPPLSRVLAIDLHSVLSEYHLVKVDRASMQNSLEVRVPFLDTGFIEFAFQLTARLKLYGERNKGLLRKAMGNVLPQSVIERGKRGFGPPLKYWFADALAGLAHERLENPMVVSEGFLKKRAVEELLRPARGKIEGAKIWRILVLESWLLRMKGRKFA